MTYSEVSNDIRMQRFAETVRNGWVWHPEVLELLKSGGTTPTEQAEAYFDCDETEGLTAEEAAGVIEYAMDDPEY